MSRFSAAERIEIAARAAANISRGRNGGVQQRDVGPRFVTKTIQAARIIDPPALQSEVMEPEPDVRGEILEVVENLLTGVIARLQGDSEKAFAKRDRAIEALDRRLDIEVALAKKVARLKTEVAEARARAPEFQSELTALRERNEKQEKLIAKLRAQASQHAYALKKLESEQQHGRQQLKVTSIELNNVSGVTRTVLERLQEEGLDLGTEYYARPN
jgi:chromosome segregation ATPase